MRSSTRRTTRSFASRSNFLGIFEDFPIYSNGTKPGALQSSNLFERISLQIDPGKQLRERGAFTIDALILNVEACFEEGFRRFVLFVAMT